jgi:hypothetical protein
MTALVMMCEPLNTLLAIYVAAVGVFLSNFSGRCDGAVSRSLMVRVGGGIEQQPADCSREQAH